MKFQFNTKDGYGNYPEGYVSFTGLDVIDYSQNWFILSTGFHIGTEILKPFTFNICLKLSPITNCNSVDRHLLRQPPYPDTFKDMTHNGFYFEPKIDASFKFWRFKLKAQFSYMLITKTLGPSFNKTAQEENFYMEGFAGASIYLLDTSFYLIYSF